MTTFNKLSNYKGYKFLFSLLLILLSKLHFGQCSQWTNATMDIPNCGSPVLLSSLVTSFSPGETFSGPGVTPSGGGYIFYPGVIPLALGQYSLTYYPTGCPSSVMTVNLISPLDILANGNSLSKITLSGSLLCSLAVASGFTNYRWYKNGFLDVSASCSTCSTYVSNDIGIYTVVADGCIANLTDEIEVVCDCSGNLISGSSPSDIGTTGITTYITSTNYTGAGGIGQSDTHVDYIVRGTVVVGEDVVLNFTTANLRMEAGSQFILQPAITSGHNGGQININNSTFTGCDKWAGINVYGNNYLSHSNPEHASLNAYLSGCEISDAFKAIYSYNGGKLNLDDVDFENNLNNVSMMHYYYDHTPTLTDLNIKGTWLHNPSYPNDFSTLYSPSYISLPSGSALSNEKMVYFEEVQMIDLNKTSFTNCDPFISTVQSNDVNGIEMYNIDDIEAWSLDFKNNFAFGIFGNYVSNSYNNSLYLSLGSNEYFDDYSFDGHFSEAGIRFDNSGHIVLGNLTPASNRNYFIGYYDEAAIIMNTCASPIIWGNLFNTVNYTYYGSPTPHTAQPNDIICSNLDVARIEWNVFTLYSTALTLIECKNTHVYASLFHDGQIGVTMIGTACNGNRNGIHSNRFISNDYSGIFISPEDPALGATANTTQMDFSIICNYFSNNKIGISGCGAISPMVFYGYGGPPFSYSSGNKFESNIDWDLLWDGYSGSYPIDYYCSNFEGTSNPNNQPNSWSGLNNGSLTINGVNTPTDITYTQVLDSSYVWGCYSGLHKTSAGVNNDLKTTKISINNPINNELIVTGVISEANTLTCFDALGKVYYLRLTSSFDGKMRFDTHDLAAGMYYAIFDTEVLKFIKVK